MASPTCQDPGIWGSLPALIPTAPPGSLGMDGLNREEKLQGAALGGETTQLPNPEEFSGSQIQRKSSLVPNSKAELGEEAPGPQNQG